MSQTTLFGSHDTVINCKHLQLDNSWLGNVENATRFRIAFTSYFYVEFVPLLQLLHPYEGISHSKFDVMKDAVCLNMRCANLLISPANPQGENSMPACHIYYSLHFLLGSQSVRIHSPINVLAAFTCRVKDV